MAEAELIQDEHTKKFPFVFIVALVFAGLFFFLMYTSFYDADITKKISGNFINLQTGNNAATVSVSGEFSLPDALTVDSSIAKLSFKLKEPLSIVIGNEQIDLEPMSSFVADSFTGSFIISGGKILHLTGTAAQIFANGVPLKDKTGKTISFEAKDIVYTYVRFDDLFLPEIEYITSGVLRLNNNAVVVRFNNEPLHLRSYQGNVEISKNYLRLEGVASDIDIEKLLKKSSLNSSNL
ncbi:MAG: hypothetical protein AABX16_01620 [Nanoarchaeota archaeon]